MGKYVPLSCQAGENAMKNTKVAYGTILMAEEDGIWGSGPGVLGRIGQVTQRR